MLPDSGTVARLTRAQETELPREASFGFTDGGADYRRSAVTSRKLVGAAGRTLHSDLAVITNDAAATRRAEIWLQDLWAGRESAEFALGMNALRLAPGDVVALSLSGRRRLFEIGDLIDTELRQVKARSIDPEVFSVPLLASRKKVPAIPAALGPVAVTVLDLPALDASMPVVLTRLAITANPWPGSVAIWASSDGASFEVGAVAAAPCAIGETLDDLQAGPTARWDRASSVRVKLYSGALASISDARVLEGGNAAAVQNADGDWEILQFANAELVDGQTWRLSRLLRGQAGSDYAMANPLPAGAPFVVLGAHMVPIAAGLDALARPMQLRIVATGRNHDDPVAMALTVTPGNTALKPLSPVHVAAVRAGDGIHISWIRRTRIDGDGWGVEVPLSEESEAYMLEILSGSVVVRSIASVTQQALYAASDELTDFGTVQTSLHVRVAQISATVGAGHAVEVTFAV